MRTGKVESKSIVPVGNDDMIYSRKEGQESEITLRIFFDEERKSQILYQKEREREGEGERGEKERKNYSPRNVAGKWEEKGVNIQEESHVKREKKKEREN